MYNPYEINHDLMTILPRVAAQYPGQTSMRKIVNAVVKAASANDDVIAWMPTQTRRLIASYVLIDLMALDDQYEHLTNDPNRMAAGAAARINDDRWRDRRLLDILTGRDVDVDDEEAEYL